MTDDPETPRAYVRFIDAAVDDLDRLFKLDPEVLRAVVKKLIQLERDPEQGEPLLGELIGWRKPVVGDRHWRVIWRATVDDRGATELTIAEVWAAGARADGEVYAEMVERVHRLGTSPHAASLAEVVARYGRHVERLTRPPTPEPAVDPVPTWLRDRLVHTAGVAAEAVDGMSGLEAMERWEHHITGQQ